MTMDKGAKIFVAGHKGLAGSAIFRQLQKENYSNLVTRKHDELDLLDTGSTAEFFRNEKPEYVFIAAARVGGIHANNAYPAQFIYENLQIQNNIIHNSYLNSVKKLLFLGSSCIYPKHCPQPMKEEHLLSGYLEPTNEPYAVAKIAGIKMCQNYNRQYKTNFISAMPSNLYGVNDNYHPQNSHVIPALIRKTHESKVEKRPEIVVWGSGKPLREFLFSDDLGEACVFLMNNYSDNEIVNLACGKEISIKELAEMIFDAVGYEGNLAFDVSKPDGAPRKLMDISKMSKLGWKAKTPLRDGLKTAYEWFEGNVC